MAAKISNLFIFKYLGPGKIRILKGGKFCFGAWSPNDFDAYSPEYLIKVKPGAPNENVKEPWSPEIFFLEPRIF